MNIFTKSIKTLLKAVFTNRCEFCGKIIEFNQTVCSSCVSLPKIEPPFCKSCGASGADCTCRKNKNEFVSVIAPYYYRDNVITAIHNLKFHEMPFISERIGRDIAECVKENYSQINFDAVSFVPFYKSKFTERDYNQSELLAKVVSKEIGVPLVKLLNKKVNNNAQRKQNAARRKANVFGVFEVLDDELTAGKTILLVDDVKTTGATLNECAKMLKIHGADKVYCAAAAIVNYRK